MPAKKEYTEVHSELYEEIAEAEMLEIMFGGLQNLLEDATFNTGKPVDKEKELGYWREEYKFLQYKLSFLKEPALSNRIAELELRLEELQNKIKELKK